MGPLDLILHLLNWMAPAIGVGLLVTFLGRFLVRKQPSALSFIARAAINVVASMLVLLAGLWFFGNDGKTATYAALVLVSATCQWLMSRGWRA